MRRILTKTELLPWGALMGLIGAVACVGPVTEDGPGPQPAQDCSRFSSVVAAFTAAPATVAVQETAVLSAEVTLVPPEELYACQLQVENAAGQVTFVEAAIDEDLPGCVGEVGAGMTLNPFTSPGTYQATAIVELEQGTPGEDWYGCVIQATTAIAVQ